jgi:drug/metabolite transporter superfamily protein YnfA
MKLALPRKTVLLVIIAVVVLILMSFIGAGQESASYALVFACIFGGMYIMGRSKK